MRFGLITIASKVNWVEDAKQKTCLSLEERSMLAVPGPWEHLQCALLCLVPGISQVVLNTFVTIYLDVGFITLT